ncbi:MAG: 4,5-dihydroxyphthalate decarboxylase, partial [Paralcaligenes sp.]
IAIRRSTFERHPWIAMNLFKAFSEAKDRSLARALDVTTSSFPIPWAPYMACQAQKMFGGNLWDYGIDPNRTTIDAFLRFSFEQGVAHRRMAVEDLFPKQLQTSVRV